MEITSAHGRDGIDEICSLDGHFLTPKVVGKARRNASRRYGHENAVSRKAAHRDTPPVDAIYRGRSPGLRVIAAILSSRTKPSDIVGRQLFAYSCGGLRQGLGSPHRILS